MARTPKPSGRLSTGPWDFEDLRTALERQGYRRREGSKHPGWKHPDRPGKVTLDEKWTGIRKGSEIYNGIVETSGYSSRQLQRMLNGLPPD